MITVNNDVARNVSRFKKISPKASKELSERSDMDEDNDIVIPNRQRNPVNPVASFTDGRNPKRRRKRNLG